MANCKPGTVGATNGRRYARRWPAVRCVAWAFASLALIAALGATTGRGYAAGVEPVKKVLLIGIDGTRFDAALRANTPHLDALMASGIHSPACQILGERYR